jgi:hypothetical protein
MAGEKAVGDLWAGIAARGVGDSDKAVQDLKRVIDKTHRPQASKPNGGRWGRFGAPVAPQPAADRAD